jgi:hypothetical protein
MRWPGSVGHKKHFAPAKGEVCLAQAFHHWSRTYEGRGGDNEEKQRRADEISISSNPNRILLLLKILREIIL